MLSCATGAYVVTLSSEDWTKFNRLVLKAKGLTQSAAGMNDFRVPLLAMFNLSDMVLQYIASRSTT